MCVGEDLNVTRGSGIHAESCAECSVIPSALVKYLCVGEQKIVGGDVYY